ncbi:MAG: beta-propeller domain-containing protein [Deltaproteobacteria bacterium]|nr:beta-propeller domain-containing protein [Deltaproteobacteria bacterium]
MQVDDVRRGSKGACIALALVMVAAWAASASAQSEPLLITCEDCLDVEQWLKQATIASMEDRVTRENTVPDDWGSDDGGGWDDDWDDDRGDDDDWGGGGAGSESDVFEATDDEDGGACCGCAPTGAESGADGDSGGGGCGMSAKSGGGDDDAGDDDDDGEGAAAGDDDFGGDDDYYDDDGDDDNDYSDDDADGGDDDDADSADPEHSETNVQEPGVDEDDIIKTDGQFLYVLSGGRLHILDANPPWATRIRSAMAVEGRPLGMHFFDDLVVTLTAIARDRRPDGLWADAPFDSIDDEILKITVIDVTDPSAPLVLRERYAEGTVAGTRRIDRRIHIVLHTTKGGPALIYRLDPWDFPSRDAFERAVEELMERNRGLIEEGTLDQWLPRSSVRDGAEGIADEGYLSPCADYYHPQTRAGGDVVSVLTLNFDGQEDTMESIGVLASGLVVYASRERVYVASSIDGARNLFGDDPSVFPDGNEIHVFDVATEPGRAVYTASALVPGFVLNQWSMSESDGFLRVAASYGDPTSSIASGVYVYDVAGGTPALAGFVDEIAPTEEIYTARFMGPRGYLVTYPSQFDDDPWNDWDDPWEEDDDGDDCQCDPLFTLDLSDPYNPAVVGELQIPGFSTYIHPLGDDHLLTIGEGGTDAGAHGGVALSIFDISDFAHPTRRYFLDLGEEGLASEAKFEHHAFFYYEPMDLLSVPISSDRWFGGGWVPRPFTGFLEFYVTPEDGFSYVRPIEHTRIDPVGGPVAGRPMPLRSAVIEDALFTLSEYGIVVTDTRYWVNLNVVPLYFDDM